MAGPSALNQDPRHFQSGEGPPPELRERFVESYVFPALGRPPLRLSMLAELLLFVI